MKISTDSEVVLMEYGIEIQFPQSCIETIALELFDIDFVWVFEGVRNFREYLLRR